LVHYLRNTGKDAHAVYIQSDEFKKLEYPDVLIRLLVAILEGIPVPWCWVKRLFRRQVPTLIAAERLRSLLTEANEQEVSTGKSDSNSRKTSGSLRRGVSGFLCTGQEGGEAIWLTHEQLVE
jgi:hypothetical protein